MIKVSSGLLFALVSVPTLACSPAADPVAEGSASYQIVATTSGQVNCSFPSNGGIGKAPGDVPQGNPPTSFGVPVSDGEKAKISGKSYNISCSMGGGDERSIDLYLEGQNNYGDQTLTSEKTWISLSGTISADGSGTGDASVFTQLSETNTNKSPCTFSVVASPNDSSELRIGESNITLSFVCPTADSSLNRKSECQLTGTIDMSDCVQK